MIQSDDPEAVLNSMTELEKDILMWIGQESDRHQVGDAMPTITLMPDRIAARFEISSFEAAYILETFVECGLLEPARRT